MHDDLKRRLRDEVAVGLGSRPASDLTDVLRRGRGKRLGLQLMATISTILVGTAIVTGGIWIVQGSSPWESDRPVQPVEEHPNPSDPVPCPTHDSAEHAGSRCLFGGEVRFRITAGWAEQFASRATSAMRMAPESLLLYDNAAGTAPMAAVRVIANPAASPALEEDEEHCPRPEAAAQVIFSAAAFEAAIQAHAGLDSTASVVEDVGGVDALRVDVTPVAGASTCGGLLGVADGSERGVPVVTGTRNDYFGPSITQVVQDGMKMRLYVMDLPPGRAQTLAISIVAEEEDFDAAVAAAEPLLDTFEFRDATAGSMVWSPVQERGPLVDVRRRGPWRDPLDAPVGWVDLKSVSSSGQHWAFELAAEPPRAARREPGRLIAYGVVLDTDRDGDADYEIGIDNDTPERGDFHVWVTDLATGETEEQFGPPYGVPIDFAHPDEADQGAAMIFFFLPGSAPLDIDGTVRFYAWAAEARDGEIVASDYAPDTGWMSRR